MSMIPDCPICKTNLSVHKIPDCSIHAAGWDRDKTRITHYYSNTFECTCCKGIIHYSEEQMNDEPMFIEISYRKQNYIPNVRRIPDEYDNKVN